MKIQAIHSLFACAALCAAPTAVAQDAAQTEESSIFGAPLVVNGKRIPDAEIKRYIVYGHAAPVLESARLRILVDQELELREIDLEQELLAERYEGKSKDELSAEEQQALEAEVKQTVRDKYTVSDEYFQWIYEDELTNFSQRFPSLDYETEISRAYMAKEFYEEQLRQTLDFDQTFFPGDPFEWPEITKEAIYAGSPEVDLITDFRETWVMRVQTAEENDTFVKPEDEMFMGLLRDYVIAAISSPLQVDIQTAIDGLPPELTMVIEGGGYRAEVKTEDIYAKIEHTVTQKVIDDTKLFLAMMAATRDRLAEEGLLMGEEERVAMIDELNAALENSMFDLNFVAVHGHRFPSTQAYVMAHHLQQSFRDKLADKMASEDGTLSDELQAHMPIANTVMGLAKVDAEVLLVSAFDFPNFEWKEDGWRLAEEKANALRAQLDAHQAKLDEQAEARRKAAEEGVNYEAPEELVPFEQFWADMLDNESEFWDPPMPATGKMPPMNALKSKGRFGSQTRNDLERMIGQSSFTHLLTGESITDNIFYSVGRGEVGGPWPGPHGYYLAYLKNRTPATRPLNASDDRHVRMLEEDFIRHEFGKYARRSLYEAEVSGL